MSPAPDPVAGDADAVDAASAAELLAALRIERGTPAPEELAALTVVLHRLRSAVPAVPPPPEPASLWSDPARRLRVGPAQGPDGWRSSSLPR
ncbi:acyl-CoA carboxylase subunit epsilon [Kineococcus gynurae]|uniref:Acyl-CoA carboxylase subunit epsilon n=1 Tax=Kineococcus gynurae TaxID=452979 RepID=A0ABV5LT58_9ACTN